MVRGEDARADVDAWLAGERLTAEGVHVPSRKATFTSAMEDLHASGTQWRHSENRSDCPHRP
jgi:hypothetical protein